MFETVKLDKEGFPINIADGLDKRTLKMSKHIDYDADSKLMLVEDENNNLYYLTPNTASSLVDLFYIENQETVAADILELMISMQILDITN